MPTSKEIREWFLGCIIPIQKWLQRAGEQEALIEKTDVDEMEAMSEEGDIVLSYEEGRPTSILIKGPWDHVSIISSKKTIVEAVGDLYKKINGVEINVGGVREKDFREFMFKKDDVCIIRPVYVNGKTINKEAAATALYYIGKDYDYKFKAGDETIYCSELEYLCYRAYDPEFLKWIGDAEILPSYYYDLCFDMPKGNCHFQLIYSTNKRKKWKQ